MSVRARSLAGAALLSAVILNPLRAQEVPPPPPDDPPSLDDLLDLDEARPDSAQRVASDRNEEELQRRLNEEKVLHAIARAVDQMVSVVSQLADHLDTGATTQRLQEDVIISLDTLIEEARHQQQKNSSRSSSSSSSSQQQQQSGSQTPPSSRNQSQQPRQDQSNQPSGESREGDPPDAQAPDLNSVLDESRAEWGRLPERIRKELLQGRHDRERFSSRYELLTREYYRRLAEQGGS